MKNEHPAFFPPNKDDIVNSLNYEGIAVIELQFYHFPDSDDACWLCHRLNGFEWLLDYGDQSTTRHNLHIIIITSPTLPQLLWMLPETPYVLYMQLQHQVNSWEMVLLSIFFTRIRSTEGSSADCSLFILSLHALTLHLAVKILWNV